jgi:hypothetical protein
MHEGQGLRYLRETLTRLDFLLWPGGMPGAH